MKLLKTESLLMSDLCSLGEKEFCLGLLHACSPRYEGRLRWMPLTAANHIRLDEYSRGFAFVVPQRVTCTPFGGSVSEPPDIRTESMDLHYSFTRDGFMVDRLGLGGDAAEMLPNVPMPEVIVIVGFGNAVRGDRDGFRCGFTTTLNLVEEDG